MTQTATIYASVTRETEKAVLAEVQIDTHCGRSAATIWLPKSQITVGDGLIELPEWLLDKKADDVRARGFIGFVTGAATLAEAAAERAERAARSAAIKAAVEAKQQAELKAVYEAGIAMRAAAR